jgi:hypothetical protein
MYASNSLAEMAKRSPGKVIPDLITGLQSSDNLVREGSAETIGKVAKSDPTLAIDSIPYLVPLLDDPDVGPALGAAEALETISKRSLQYFEEHVEQLRPAINHWNGNVSDPVKRILTRLGKLEKSSGRAKANSVKTRRTRQQIDAVPEVESDYVFILMAFKEDPLLEDVVDTIKGICSSLQLRAERVDDIQHFGRITDKIIERIKASRILIADLSFERPNVYYELGFAHGLNRDVILLAKQGTDLHFDIKDFNVLFYRNIKELSSKLKKSLRVALGVPE